MLAVTGTAGACVGALQEALPGNGSRGRQTLAVVGPAGAGPGGLQHLAGAQARATETAISRARTRQASLAKSIAYGVGMAAALSAFGEGERQFADRISRLVARVLPGNAALWRPVAHAAAFAGLAAGARVLAVKALARIEQTQESAEAAFDFPPPNPS